MKKNIIYVILMFIGLLSLIFCITDEVDGIGRFALIVFGSFLIIFSFFKKSDK